MATKVGQKLGKTPAASQLDSPPAAQDAALSGFDGPVFTLEDGTMSVDKPLTGDVSESLEMAFGAAAAGSIAFGPGGLALLDAGTDDDMRPEAVQRQDDAALDDEDVIPDFSMAAASALPLPFLLPELSYSSPEDNNVAPSASSMASPDAGDDPGPCNGANGSSFPFHEPIHEPIHEPAFPQQAQVGLPQLPSSSWSDPTMVWGSQPHASSMTTFSDVPMPGNACFKSPLHDYYSQTDFPFANSPPSPHSYGHKPLHGHTPYSTEQPLNNHAAPVSGDGPWNSTAFSPPGIGRGMKSSPSASVGHLALDWALQFDE